MTAAALRGKRVVVTGGAGFIGSALTLALVEAGAEVTVIDKMTYAASPDSLKPVEGRDNFRLVKADICDGRAMSKAFEKVRPDVVFHLAAESHVDRSIRDPAAFLRTNVIGTQTLIDVCRDILRDAVGEFRFIHVSTDEVFGSLGPEGAFTETSPYDPSSPYSASKAASDHMVRAAARTFGFPALISNCSNNYGPRQFPEKLIPLMIVTALWQQGLPVYGDGLNVRDWLHVEDHVDALCLMATKGRVGETYAIGGGAERSNNEVVQAICAALDARMPDRAPHARLIRHVTDRPGHDRRYAIDSSKIRRELGWAPAHDFERGLKDTVDWYIDNRKWWEPLQKRYGGAT